MINFLLFSSTYNWTMSCKTFLSNLNKNGINVDIFDLIRCFSDYRFHHPSRPLCCGCQKLLSRLSPNITPTSPKTPTTQRLYYVFAEENNICIQYLRGDQLYLQYLWIRQSFGQDPIYNQHKWDHHASRIVKASSQTSG